MLLISDSMTQDRMQKYENPFARVFKVVGLVSGLVGVAFGRDHSTALAVYGTSLFLGGYAMEMVSYTRGYFNERLRILSKKEQAGELEKKVEVKS